MKERCLRNFQKLCKKSGELRRKKVPVSSNTEGIEGDVTAILGWLLVLRVFK